MRVTVVTPPATEPITTAEAKAFLRVEHAEDDALIGALIAAAREAVERHTARALLTQTRRAYYDAAEARLPLVLPYGPVQSVTAAYTHDAGGTETAVSAGAYYLAGDRIALSPSTDAASWPTYERGADALSAVFVAGYGDTAEDVPEQARLAVRYLVADYYENRLSAGEVSPRVERLLAPLVNYQFG